MTSEPMQFLLAKVGSYNSSGATLVFDGQTSATTKRYKCYGAFTPEANQRVLVARVGGTYVVIGGAGATGGGGEPGAPAVLVSNEIKYQSSSSGTTVPSGTWQSSPPTVSPGDFLWTRIVLTFNTGDPVTAYSVAKAGATGATGSQGPQGPQGDSYVLTNQDKIDIAALITAFVASDADPLMDGTADPGTSVKYSREDHVHPTDTSRAADADHKLKTYTSVADIGLTVGSATIAGAFSALPNGASLYAFWTDFPQSELPGNYKGTVEITKEPGGGGYIYFHGQTTAYGDGVMRLTSSGAPNGTWENPAAQNNLAGTDLTNLSSYTSTAYTFPADGYVFVSNSSSQTGYLLLMGAGQTTAYVRVGNSPGYHTCFVKKGMKCTASGTSGTMRYAKLT